MSSMCIVYMYVVYIHAGVWIHLLVCTWWISKWRLLGVLLCHAPPYFLETGSLSIPGPFSSRLVSEPTFLHGSRNLSSGPSACVARALTSSTPQTLSICFGDKVFYVGLAETCTQWYKPSLAINPWHIPSSEIVGMIHLAWPESVF